MNENLTELVKVLFVKLSEILDLSSFVRLFHSQSFALYGSKYNLQNLLITSSDQKKCHFLHNCEDMSGLAKSHSYNYYGSNFDMLLKIMMDTLNHVACVWQGTLMKSVKIRGVGFNNSKDETTKLLDL